MAQIENLKQEGEGEMKPWEQHSAIISIPRFDYNAPSSLLHHSHSGFLITCPIKREKSATKEAITILGKFFETSGSDFLFASDSIENVKRRKLDPAEEDSVTTTKSEVSKDDSQCSELMENSVKKTCNLLLVKVTRSGLLLFTFPKGCLVDPVNIVSQINKSLESGLLKRPLWCHRIFPIQATCRLNEKEVRSNVTNLVQKFVNDKSNTCSKSLKFAVGYNRRGIEEKEMKTIKDKTSDSNQCDLLDRNKCFALVAATVKEVVSDSIVDLKTPELCILIELLPLSGVPTDSLVTAISVLPRDLVSTKPRLCVKPLVLDPKSKKEAS